MMYLYFPNMPHTYRFLYLERFEEDYAEPVKQTPNSRLMAEAVCLQCHIPEHCTAVKISSLHKASHPSPPTIHQISSKFVAQFIYPI
jgi:hypothetical protein